MQDIWSYLPLLLRGCARLSAAFNNLPNIDVKDALYRSKIMKEKSGRKKHPFFLFYFKRFLFSRRVSTRPAKEWSNWSTRDLLSRIALWTDSKLEPVLNCLRVLVTRDIYLFIIMSSRFDLSCLLLSYSIFLSFSLAVILAVILRLPTRVSRSLSRVRARNETTVRKPLSKF